MTTKKKLTTISVRAVGDYASEVLTDYKTNSKTLCVTGEAISADDGYHTFAELYDHRITLYVALCRAAVRQKRDVWKSKLHSDGSDWEGWFILGIGTEQGKQITYHLPIEKWEECSFAQTVDKAPKWDGHKPSDVLRRLEELFPVTERLA